MSTKDLATQLLSITPHLNRCLSTQGSVDLKPMLRSLYCFLLSSFNSDVSLDDYAPMTTLHSMLFEELRKRLSLNLHRPSKDRDVNWASVHSDFSDSMKELLLLLRCYVLIVRLDPQDHILMHKLPHVFFHHTLPFQNTEIGRVSLSFTKEASSQRMCSSCSTSGSNDLQARSCDSCSLVLKRILEVILDEMFADRKFRQSLALLYTFSSTEEDQSTSSVHLESILDVITAHCVLSVSGEKFLETFTKKLIWTKNQTSCTPELSLSAAISLVKHPLMSPPILLRAHLISLVSDVIGISDFADVSRNIRYMEYLSVFHDSVIIYSEYMSKFPTDSCDSPFKIRSSGRPGEPNFRSKIYDDFNFMVGTCDIGKSDSSEMENDAISYLKMYMFIVAESSRDEVFSFLCSLIKSVISSEADENICRKINKMTMQDYCFLASILKLMSCSLLRATCSTKRRRSLVGMMSCVVEYKLHLPIQVRELIDDAMKLAANVESKMILMHFSGLLLLCKVTGLNFLVKGCLFTIMVFMNMLIFEGSLEFMRPSSNLVPKSITISHEYMSRLMKCEVRKMSSLNLASDFQRTRKLLLREQTANEEAEATKGEDYLKYESQQMEQTVNEEAEATNGKDYLKYESQQMEQTANEEAEATNGEDYLKYESQQMEQTANEEAEATNGEDYLKYESQQMEQTANAVAEAEAEAEAEATNGEDYLKLVIREPDTISELADFIVCKPGKDYTAMLRIKAELRFKRGERRATQLWKRKKKAGNSMGNASRRK